MFFLIVKLALASVNELEIENEELRIANDILHKQLLDLSKLTDIRNLIEEDFQYNKAKLNALLDELLDSSKEPSVKLSLSEQIIYYLNTLNQDIKILGGSIDSVTSEYIETLISSLNHITDEYRSKQLTQEFNSAYQDLKLEISHKDESLKSLQIENAKLLGMLDSSHTEYDQLSQKHSHLTEKLESLNVELDQTRSDQSKRLENLKANLQSEESNSRSKEISDFQKIQKSQDELIQTLQSKNTEQSLKIEELAMSKVTLLSKIKILNNTIERLESEIKARNTQIDVSLERFEDFKREIEIETNNEIITLRNSEELLKVELESMQKKQMELLEELTKCTKELDELEMEKRQKDNIIKELEMSIEDARNGIRAAKESRSQEIVLLEEKVKDAECVLDTLQNQLDEALLKISSQNKEIRELSDRLLEFQFLADNNIQNKGNLRGFSILSN